MVAVLKNDYLVVSVVEIFCMTPDRQAVAPEVPPAHTPVRAVVFRSAVGTGS